MTIEHLARSAARIKKKRTVMIISLWYQKKIIDKKKTIYEPYVKEKSSNLSQPKQSPHIFSSWNEFLNIDPKYLLHR